MQSRVVAMLLLCCVMTGVIALQESVAQDISVRAQLSASSITRDESVTLTITAMGIDAELDATSLDKDFDVVSRSSSRQINTLIDSSNQMVNTTVVTWALELLPRGVGVFTVPAVKVGDLETQLQTLTVSEVPSGAKRDVFVEASVDTTDPWVQSQVVMTLRVFDAIGIVDGGLDVPSANDLVVERLGEDERSREVRDGREYSVTERRFALFPQRSGSMTIDPVTLSVTVPAQPDRVRGFFSPTRKLTRRTDAIMLNVQARPPTGSAWWLPARNLQLQSQWQGDPEQARVDQPLTRTVVIRADGVLESQLPTISIPAVDGLSLYAEEPALGRAAGPSGLISEQRINWALIPQRSGSVTLPAVTVEWFNTLTGQSETAELPAETITVLAGDSAATDNAVTDSSTDAVAAPLATDDNTDALASLSDSAAGVEPLVGPGDADNTAVTSASTSNRQDEIAVMQQQVATLQDSTDRWRLLSFAALVLWMLTLVAWWVFRRPSTTAQSAKGSERDMPAARGVEALYRQLAPMRELEQACETGDAQIIKKTLLAWAQRQWSDNAPLTLDDLQSRLPAGAAQNKLALLQRTLYSHVEKNRNKEGSDADWTRLAAELRHALHKAGSDSDNASLDTSAVNGGRVSSGGSSRLPGL